jgi:hypothetical protein
MIRLRAYSGSLCFTLAIGGLACSSTSSAGSLATGGGDAGASSSAGGAAHAGESNLGGSASGGAPSHAGAANGGTNSGSAGGANVGGTGVTWAKVYVTWYGYDDNSCQTEAQHTCANIAYPKSDGYSTLHDGATEGKGNYDDPVTFAAAVKDDPETFGGASIKPGTIIYYPKVKKYFMMEDSCAECTDEWTATQLLHVDLWMGPSTPPQGQTMFGQPLIDCEDHGTDSSADNPTDTIIVDPPSTLVVDQTMLFTGTQCNVPQ